MGTAHFFLIFQHSCRNLALCWPAEDLPSIPSSSGIFLKLVNVAPQLLMQLAISPFGDNNLVAIYFWWMDKMYKSTNILSTNHLHKIRGIRRRCSIKRRSWKLHKFLRKSTCIGVTFSIKLQAWTLQFCKKEKFSC